MLKLKDEVFWLLAIVSLAAFLNAVTVRRLGLDDGISALIFAPILEESLKFVAIRAGARPLFIGIGVQIVEAFVTGFPVSLGMFGEGVIGTEKLPLSVHWMTAFLYDKRGAKWRYLPLAICFHSIWNMTTQISAPNDTLPMAGLILMVTWILWQLRTKEKQ